MAGVLIRKAKFEHRNTGGNVKMGAQNGVMLLQVKECQELQTTTRIWRRLGWILSYKLQRKNGPVDTLILDF